MATSVPTNSVGRAKAPTPPIIMPAPKILNLSSTMLPTMAQCLARDGQHPLDIENILGGMSADLITGDNSTPTPRRQRRALDTIYGGSGNDHPERRCYGKDRLYGQNGDDVFMVNDGNRDTLDGGAGTDSASRDHSSTVADDVLNIEKFI